MPCSRGLDMVKGVDQLDPEVNPHAAPPETRVQIPAPPRETIPDSTEEKRNG